ncbi:DUF3473 domain-containing protein [Methanoculleus sp. FWC-SCC1]|uniref:DUF3473 domain-containing protein n=2 Tax=Methanoculleus frigidifontis TaxID=2584085 RepID=A0ABT8MCJ5_9EURY|nr:DUF3473 domain-containing protein [Methanoculleus sp. FWC-SCC1]
MSPTSNNSLAVTIDIEDWYHIPSVCGSPFSAYKGVEEFYNTWTERYDYLTEPTHRVLNLLNQFNIRATFFVVADVVNRYPGLVKSIVEQGHEIACHGLTHACKIDPATKQPLLSQEQFEIQTLHAKQILEKVSGDKIIGYRAPNALIGGWMIDSLERMGFRYDSSVSVNSLYNKTDSSLSGVSSYPYYPSHGGLEPSTLQRSIVEFPFAYYNLGAKIPTSGGPMLRFLGGRVVYQGIKQCLKRGDSIFYFHPIDISTESFPDVGNKRPFYWIVKGKLVEKRVRYILGKFKDRQTATLGELVKNSI